MLFIDLDIGMTRAVQNTVWTEKKQSKTKQKQKQQKTERLNRFLGESFKCLHSGSGYG